MNSGSAVPLTLHARGPLNSKVVLFNKFLDEKMDAICHNIIPLWPSISEIATRQF